MFLTFNGSMPSYATVMEIHPPIKAPVAWGTYQVPGRPGVVLLEKTIDPITIPVRFLIEGRDREEYERNKEDFADWLDTDKVAPLVFSHDPQRTYYAVVQGAAVPEDELVIYSEVVIEFFVPNPYKFAPEKTAPFVNGAANIFNRGTVEVKPTILVEVLADLTYLDVISADRYMRIGKPADLGVPVQKDKDLMLHNAMDNLTGWSSAGLNVDGGVVTGSFAVDQGRFKVNSFGTGGAFHGPAIKIGVPGAPLTDWQVDFELDMLPTQIGKNGRVEMYFLDDLGAHIGKVGLTTRGQSYNVGEVRIGGGANYKYLVSNYTGGPNRNEWNNFAGIMRLVKKGNVYSFYIARVSYATKRHSYIHAGTYIDYDNQFTAALSQVQLHIGVYGTQTPVTGMMGRDVKVWRLNDIQPTDPRIIATVGDVIELNFEENAIYINGEERKELKDMFATFFKLPRGNSALTIDPADKVNAVATIREGYK